MKSRETESCWDALCLLSSPPHPLVSTSDTASDDVLLLCSGMPAEKPDIKRVLRDNKHVPAFAIRWLVFGSAGHMMRPSPGGPLQHYDSCGGKMAPQSKCLANMWHAGEPMLATIHTCGHLCASSCHGRMSGSAVH
jgi:hypothetical protein